jgi:hypothetical protein
MNWQQILSKKTFHNVLFVLCLGLMAWGYSYPKVVSYGPVSLHYWRQSDGASMARMYYENGMNFFEPMVHNQVGGQNHAVGEFPVLYYAVACLYKLFGPDDAIFRLFNFSIFFLGVLALFNLMLDHLRHVWLAFLPGLMLFASPLVAYYALNFIPNTTALGLFLIAAWIYNRYVLSRKLWVFYLSVLFLLLVALIKVTMLIPFLAWVGAGILLSLIPTWRRYYPAFFPPIRHLLVSLPIIVLPFIAWLMWAKQYNEIHGAGIFLLSIKPVWQMAMGDIHWTTKFLLEEQRKMYFHGGTLLLMATGAVVFLIRPKLNLLPLYLLFLFTTLGSIGFILLFYSQLAIHHYYFLDIFPMAMVLICLACYWLDRSDYLPRHKTLAMVLASGLLLPNVYASVTQLSEYYEIGGTHIPDPFPSLLKKEELKRFLQENGIQYPSMAVVVPDISPNNALYHLNLKGWSYDRPLTEDELKMFAGWEGKYFIVLDSTYLKNNPLPNATSKLIGVFDDHIYFYDLTVLKE